MGFWKDTKPLELLFLDFFTLWVKRSRTVCLVRQDGKPWWMFEEHVSVRVTCKRSHRPMVDSYFDLATGQADEL